MTEPNEDVACHLYLVFAEYLPFCGCGNPEDGYRLVHRLLTLAPFYDGTWGQVGELCGSAGATQLVVAAMDRAELLDHGSSLAGSWLTDRGRWVLWAVEQVGGIDALEACIDKVGFPHDGDQECADACWRIPPEEART